MVNAGGGASGGTLFGPIVPVMAFDDIATALEYVVTSDHGQQASIFSARSQRSN